MNRENERLVLGFIIQPKNDYANPDNIKIGVDLDKGVFLSPDEILNIKEHLSLAFEPIFGVQLTVHIVE